MLFCHPITGEKLQYLLNIIIFLLSTTASAQALIELEALEYTRPKLHRDLTSQHAGFFIANRINYQNEYFYLKIKNTNKYQADIYQTPNLLEFVSKEASDFGFATQDLGEFINIKALKTKNLLLNYNDLNFLMKSKSLSLNYAGHELDLFNLDFSCARSEVPFPFNCLNESIILPNTDINKKTEIHYKNKMAKIDFKTTISSANLTQDNINFHAHDLFYKDTLNYVTLQGAHINCTKGAQKNDAFEIFEILLECANRGEFEILKLNLQPGMFKTKGFGLKLKTNDKTFDFNGKLLSLKDDFFELLIKDVNAKCQKDVLNNKTEINDLLMNCYRWSNLQAKKAIYNDRSKNVGEFVFEGIDLRDNDIKIIASEFDFTYNDLKISVSLKKLIANCPKIPKMANFSFDKIVNYCLSNAQLNLKSLALTGEDYNIDIETDRIGLHSEQFYIIGKKLVFTSPKTKITVNGFDINCLREINPKNLLDFTKVPQNCFESSVIKIESILFEDILFKMHINFKEIEFNRDKISLNIPKATYGLNGEDIEFEGLNFTCFLDRKIKKFENITLDNLLEICLANSIINIKKLKNSASSGIRLATLARMEAIKFNSRDREGGNFRVRLNPIIKYLGFLKPKLLKGTLKGNITYQKESKKIIIRMDSFKIWKTIPAKKVLKWVIDSFIDHKLVTLKKDSISISLE